VLDEKMYRQGNNLFSSREKITDARYREKSRETSWEKWLANMRARKKLDYEHRTSKHDVHSPFDAVRRGNSPVLVQQCGAAFVQIRLRSPLT